MKKIEKFLWRYKWAGRKVTSSVHWTEEEVRKDHPDAVKVEGSGKVFEVPETEAEVRETMRRTDTAAFRKPG